MATKGIGSLLGGAAGAAVGTTIIPGMGTEAGSAIGQTVGGAVDQLIASNKEKAAAPLAEDPSQRALLDEVSAKRKAMEMGLDVTTQAAVNQNDQTGEAARAAIVRATGGNAGQTVDALLKSQKAESAANNAAYGQLATRVPFYQSLEDNINDRVAQRKLELDLRNMAQSSAEKAQYGKEALSNFSAGVAGDYFGINQQQPAVQKSNPMEDLVANINNIFNGLFGGKSNVNTSQDFGDVFKSVESIKGL